MMKPFRLLIILFFLPAGSYANKIDSLQTDADIEQFAAKLVGGIYSNWNAAHLLKRPDSIFILADCANNERAFENGWKKTDFNKDGLTDLFVILYYIDTVAQTGTYHAYVITGSNNGTYPWEEIPSRSSLHCFSVKPFEIDDTSCLLYNYSKDGYVTKTYPGEYDTLSSPTDPKKTIIIPRVRDSIFQFLKSDTLVYKYGGFINANFSGQYSPEIRSIFFETDVCYGGCPVFSLLINKNGTAVYKTKPSFSFDEAPGTKPGKVRGKINTRQLNEIMQLISYMNIKTLDEAYNMMVTHQPRGTLKISFNDGSVKTIKDNGLHGTLSLSRLYVLLFNLRGSQEWKK